MQLPQDFRSLWPRQNPQRQPKKTQATWKSFGSSVETSAMVVGNCVTFHSKMKSTLTCLPKPLSAAYFCYCDGKDDYNCLNANPASGMSGHRAGDSNYVIWAVWGHILPNIMISWSFHWTNILKYYWGKDDFIFKYCCNTLRKRMRALMVCEYHKIAGDPLAFSLFFQLISIDNYLYFWEIWLFRLLPKAQSHSDLILKI